MLNTVVNPNVNERTVKQSVIPKKISKISFSVATDDDIRKMSHIELINKYLYLPKQNKEPFPYGALDTKLGVCSKRGICDTCGLTLKDCTGHFGYINLELPVFHIGYFKAIVEGLQRICKVCIFHLFQDL